MQFSPSESFLSSDSKSSSLSLQNRLPLNSKYKNLPINPIQIQKKNLERPQTSYKGKENQKFQPVYTTPYNSFLITNKVFNYKDKNFRTVPKKSDPVKKYQDLQKNWAKTKNLNTKEGRKLNLVNRIQQTKPEEMFYRYVNKADLV